MDFFFALSGFVVVHAYGVRLRAGMTFARFARVRAVRLMPLVLLAGLLSCGLLAFHPPDSARTIATLASMLALPSPVPSLPNVASAFPINGPSWSLFFELLVNSAFAMAATRLTTWRLRAVVLVSFAWLALLATPMDSINALGHTRSDLLGGVPRTLFSFTVGVLLYGVIRKESAVGCPVLAVAAVILVATFLPRAGTGLWYELLCVAVVYPAIILVTAKVRLTGATERIAALVGALSFPVYILHYPLFFLAEEICASGPRRQLLICTIAICLFSFAALKLYDEPLRRYLLSRTSRRLQADLP